MGIFKIILIQTGKAQQFLKITMEGIYKKKDRERKKKKKKITLT